MRRATTCAVRTWNSTVRFQSTLSMRRATHWRRLEFVRHLLFQSTLSMRRATIFPDNLRFLSNISIHALHEESDAAVTLLARCQPFQSTLSMRRATGAGTLAAYQVTLFQSTLSMRRATASTEDQWQKVYISIHALHEESDIADFRESLKGSLFQSTLSMRRATGLTAL